MDETDEAAGRGSEAEKPPGAAGSHENAAAFPAAAARSMLVMR